MQTRKLISLHTGLLLGVAALGLTAPAGAANLSLGADYLLRGVSVKEADKTVGNNKYYDQRLEAYLTTDLSKDVEASLRVQSITPWGLETSTTPLQTRYPNANGTPWIQNAYVRLPNIWKNHLILTIGRQPIQWGDGAVLSDDELGFNALRAHFKSPFVYLPFDADVFTAKVAETFRQNADADVSGIDVGFDRDALRWDFVALDDENKGQQIYQVAGDTTPFSASKVSRIIYGMRAKIALRDAFLRGEYYMQAGKVTPSDPTAQSVKLGGNAFIIGLGGKKSNIPYFGRFGAILEFESATGDDPSSKNKDEAFRPTFASRWSGLERKGFGKYLDAGFNDVYSISNPFGQVNTTNTGLPAGTSGLQNAHFGVDCTPWAQWTFSVDFYQSSANKNISGSKDLGTEFDYGVEYRYSGLVTFRASLADFRAKEGLGLLDNKRNAQSSSAEAEVKF